MSQKFDKFEAVERMRLGKRMRNNAMEEGSYVIFDGGFFYVLRQNSSTKVLASMQDISWDPRVWEECVEPFDHTKLKNGDHFEVSFDQGKTWHNRRYIGPGFAGSKAKFYYTDWFGCTPIPQLESSHIFRLK